MFVCMDQYGVVAKTFITRPMFLCYKQKLLLLIRRKMHSLNICVALCVFVISVIRKQFSFVLLSGKTVQ